MKLKDGTEVDLKLEFIKRKFEKLLLRMKGVQKSILLRTFLLYKQSVISIVHLNLQIIYERLD